MNWLWIIVAFLAGAIVAYWLCTRSLEDTADVAPATPEPEPKPEPAPQPQAAAAVAEPTEATAESAEPESEPTGEPDDLTRIEGIGPKISELIQGGGISTFAQLGAAPVERLQEILDEAGSRYQVHNPASWPMQAQLAAAGKWDELEELQDRLDGGKLT